MDDKEKSRKESVRHFYPHLFRERCLKTKRKPDPKEQLEKPVYWKPVLRLGWALKRRYREYQNRDSKHAPTEKPVYWNHLLCLSWAVKRRYKEYQNRGKGRTGFFHRHRERRQINPPDADAVGGPDDERFIPTREQVPSPNPRRNSKVVPVEGETTGVRHSDFLVEEGIVTAGAVGGAISSVDVHPHGDVRSNAEEYDSGDSVLVSTLRPTNPIFESVPQESYRIRTIIRSVGIMIRDFVSMVTPFNLSRNRHRLLESPPPQPKQFSSQPSSENNQCFASVTLDSPGLESSTDLKATSALGRSTVPISEPNSPGTSSILESSRASEHFGSDDEYLDDVPPEEAEMHA